MDFLTDPQDTLNATLKLVDVLERSTDVLYRITEKSNCGGGMQGWMNMWSKGKILQLQCDLSVMISAELFKEYIVKELECTTKFLTNAIYHLDGMEQIRHLDSILTVKGIDMIQWTQVAGQPPIAEFIPQLLKIQKAGKGVLAFVGKAQIKPLLDNLSIKGLSLIVSDADTPEEADDILRYVSKYTK